MDWITHKGILGVVQYRPFAVVNDWGVLIWSCGCMNKERYKSGSRVHTTTEIRKKTTNVT